MAVDDLEQNAVHLAKQPLQMKWQIASVMHSELMLDLLYQCKNFRLLHSDRERACFIWMINDQGKSYQWGYLIIEQGYLLISMPPGKDINRFIKDIRRTVKSADIVVAFRPFKSSIKTLKAVENYLSRSGEFFPTLNSSARILDDEDWNGKQGFLLNWGIC